MSPKVTKKKRLLSRRHLLTLGIGGLGAGLLATLFSMAGSTDSTAPAGAALAQNVPSGKMTATEAYNAAQSGAIILVDIRRPDEWESTGIAVGAIALDMREDSFVPSLVALRQANPDTPIAMICRTGNRTQFVVSALSGQGFLNLIDVSEGMAGGPNGKGWKNTGLPVYTGNSENIDARLAEVMPE